MKTADSGDVSRIDRLLYDRVVRKYRPASWALTERTAAILCRRKRWHAVTESGDLIGAQTGRKSSAHHW